MNELSATPNAPIEPAPSASGRPSPSEVEGGAPRRHPPEDRGDAPASHRREDEEFEPVVIGFTCNWCSYRAADLAGTARMKYPANIRLVRLMCSGRLDPAFVFEAFAHGADGVLVSGCWPGDCHYLEQNYYALRRFHLLKRTLAGLGLEPQRIKLVWASAAEGQRLATEFGLFVEEVRGLGPLHWGASRPRRERARRPSAPEVGAALETALTTSGSGDPLPEAPARATVEATTGTPVDEVTA